MVNKSSRGENVTKKTVTYTEEGKTVQISVYMLASQIILKTNQLTKNLKFIKKALKELNREMM